MVAFLSSGFNLKRKIATIFFTVTQLLSLVSIFLLLPFHRTKKIIKGNTGLDFPKGTLIIANHQSRIDPFFIAYHLGVKNFLNRFPVVFPVASPYMRNFSLGLLLKLLCCFDIGESPIEKAAGLIKIKKYLRQKKTLLIFPEGKIVRNKSEAFIFEKGVMFLADDTTPILPVYIDGLATWSLFSKKRYQTKIIFSELIGANVSKEEKIKKIKDFYTLIHE
jgi:1-acyl-sn-glycerol-3-phosphate acyltransferase